MVVLSTCKSLVVLIIFYVLTSKVLSVEINCKTVENCPLAINILSKRYIPAPSKVWNLFNISNCGLEEKTKIVKIRCPSFPNCKTPDNEFGTCIPVKSCADLALFLNINVSAELKVNLPFKEYLCGPHKDPEQHVCCPWPMESSRIEVKNELIFENDESNKITKRHSSNVPWHAYGSNGNNFFENGPNQFYNNYGYGPGKFSFDLPDFNFDSVENFYTQQSSVNFYDKLRYNQRNTINKFQILLQKESRYLQRALQNQAKKNEDTNLNKNNDFLSWLKSFPRKKNYNKYNLTEKTYDSKQETCITPDNFEGTCKLIRQCPSYATAVSNVNTTNLVETEYLKKFRCKGTIMYGDAKVCCSDRPIVFPSAVNRIVETKPEIVERNNNPLVTLSNICGRETIQNRIVGGTTTDLAEFPWTALLYYTTSRGSTFGCGGSVISNRYIVTAAHCVDLEILREAGLLRLQRVVLGDYDRRNETDCIYTRFGSDCADPPQSFGVERIIEHESFRPTATPNDIALIRLDRNVIFNDFVRPICLPEASLNLSDNENLTITGWGRTESGELSPIKRKATLPVVGKENCNQLGTLTDGQICLGSGKGIDSCKGDSGGPVMRRTLSISNEPLTVLAGIISFGFGRCGTTTSVSTYVPGYTDWILKNIS